MRVYYIITLLGIICVSILQTLYVQNMYDTYKKEEVVQIEKDLRIAFSQETKERSRKLKPHPLRGRTFTAKSITNMTPEELDSLLRIEPIPYDTIDLDRFKDDGIILTEAEGWTLFSHDDFERDGLPFNLAVLDSIFHAYYTKDFPYSFTLLYYKDRQPIETIGDLKGKADYESRLMPIGTKGERRLLLKMDIPFSYFVTYEAGPLVASLVIVLFVLLCLIFQLTVIRLKSERLKQWETHAHGTIHDLKAPLNSVVTMLSLFRLTEKDPQKKDLLNQGVVQLKRLAGTIEMLLSIENNHRELVLRKTELDLPTLCEPIKQELDVLYHDKPHKIEITSTLPDKTKVEGDAMYIENVLRNLIENALKYADAGVKVFVRFQENAQHQVEATIEDNGWGIEPKYRRKLFSQFYQVPRPTGKMLKGHGIGLAQCKLIVEAHGGKIGLHDTNNDKGSLFYFTLPLIN